MKTGYNQKKYLICCAEIRKFVLGVRVILISVRMKL